MIERRVWPVYVLMCGLGFIFFFHLTWRPYEAWDFLSFWGVEAIAALRAMQQGQEYILVHRHPGTIPFLMSIAMDFKAGFIIRYFWLLMLLSFCAQILLFFRSKSREGKALFFAGCIYVLVTMPLVENHFLLVGYMELLMALVFCSSALVVTDGMLAQKKSVVALGILISFTALTMKNVGVVYPLIIIWSFFGSWIYKIGNSVFLAYVLFSVVGPLAALSFEWTLPAFQLSLQDGVFRGFGRAMPIVFNNCYDVFNNVLQALFVNSSFSTIFLTVAICVIAVLKGESRVHASILVFLLLAIFQLHGLNIASQVFTEYGFVHATIGNDTGQSRFLIPCAVLSVVAALVVGQSLASYSPSSCPQRL